jgi:hypothetical protein
MSSGVASNYLAAAVLYNLQILPESIMCGLIILAVVLANQPLLVLAAAAAFVQLIFGGVGRLIMKFQPEQAVVANSMSSCVSSMGFIGKSWQRLMNPDASAADLLWHPLSPSLYMGTVSFFAGWGYALNQLYKDEINAGVLNRSSMTTMGVITGLLLLMALLFRIFSGCESTLGALGGTVLGAALGYFMAIAVGYMSDRRLTNIWGIPLLRDRINAGQPVYVCGA